ncbi:MAG: hypothetical protein GY798_26830 [Hyphomicrobiales bacterium]|nr:hypothetical protein [Hyphomicrobiales bacterium]
MSSRHLYRRLDCRVPAAFLLVTLTAGLTAESVARAAEPAETEVIWKDRVVTTGLLNFDLHFPDPEFRIAGNGGGLALSADGVIIARDRTGRLNYYDRQSGEIHTLRLALPDNNTSALPATTESGQEITRVWHRYTDIAVTERDGEATLLASYTHYHQEERCFTNRLAAHPLGERWIRPAPDEAVVDRDGWQTVFETAPCLGYKNVGHPYAGNQAGGRLALDQDGRVYLTVGDFQFDGVNSEGLGHSQRPESHYGKILRFDANDWSVTTVSIGHRNPQGIVVDDSGRIWSVEHGPMGGDELNLVEDGLNYGWPRVTFGVHYTEPEDDDKSWPPNKDQGRHDGYQKPVFAWLPSIAPSNLEQIRNLDPRWDNDLLVSSLRGRSLFRIRLDGERVILVEPVNLRARVRYVEVGNGELYVLFDSGRFATLRPRLPVAEPPVPETSAAEATDISPAGETDPSALAAAGCVECHATPDAPRLAGIYESRIGRQAGIDYSDALTGRKGKWPKANLRAYLKDPQKFAPGTTMPNADLSNRTIKRLIRELRAETVSEAKQPYPYRSQDDHGAFASAIVCRIPH